VLSILRRAFSINVEVIVAVMTVGKAIPTSITSEATSGPAALVGTTSP
jgi:hypothetical protein